MDLRETYNRIAKDWHHDHNDDDWWKEGADKFIGLLGPGDLVLDVGCGAGIKTKYLIEKGLQVIGIDNSEGMLTIAKENAPHGKFHCMDLRGINQLSDQFAGIFAQAVLLHIPKKEVSSVLENLTSKLKSGGYLYLTVKEQRPGGPEEETVTESDYGYEYERFFSYFTVDDLKSFLQNAKLKIVYEKILPTGKTQWLQLISQRT